MPSSKQKPAKAPGSEPPLETRIQIEGSDNAVATGPKSIAANVRIIFQGGWKPVAVILMVVAALLGLVLWFVIPRQERTMTRQFNVAVAEFAVQNGAGKNISNASGKTLAGYVSQEIETQFAAMQLDTVLSNQVWGPEKTGWVSGATPEERAHSAAELAQRINAYVLIYGVIVIDGAQSKFLPEFYVNHASFRDASEITGSHEFGRQLLLKMPFTGIQGAENPALAGRIRALDLISIGLAYYSVDKFDQALEYFQRAALEPDWVGSGHEIAYLLIGNAYVRKDSQLQQFTDLPLAGENYQLALDANPGYGRALIGSANVLYLQAAQDKKNCDTAGLERASQAIQQALELPGQPASANIETKAHFYSGQIAFIRDACGFKEQGWLGLAENEFNWVRQEYEKRLSNKTDSAGIASLASHAYARLGLIAYIHNNPEAAIAWMKKAIDPASPYYQGFYTAMLGDIYTALGRKDEARQSYENAISIAEQNADALSLKTYQAKLQGMK